MSDEHYTASDFHYALDDWNKQRREMKRLDDRATFAELRRAAKVLNKLNRIAAYLAAEESR